MTAPQTAGTLSMVRYGLLQLAVTTGALIALAYSGAAELAAEQVNHGTPASVAVNIEMTLALVFGVLCVFATFGALAANLGQMGAAIVIVAIFAGAVVTGDVWGAHWFATDLSRDLAAHRPWYMVVYPGSAAFLSWWITISLALGILVVYVRDRRHGR